MHSAAGAMIRASFAIRATLGGGILAAALAACGTEELLVLGCNWDDDASPGIQGILQANTGTQLDGLTGTDVAVGVVLTDHEDEALCDIPIDWSVGDAGGLVTPSQSRTSEGGEAEATWRRGAPGTRTLTATVVNSDPVLTVTFTSTVTGAGPHLEIVSGDGQSAGPGASLPNPLRVRMVRGSTLITSPDYTLTWTVSGGGSLETGTTITSGGESENAWTLGSANALQRVTVTADPGGTSVTFAATVTASGSHPRARISAYNGSSFGGVTVTMQTPFDGQRVFGPLGLNVQASDSLQVEANTAFQISAVAGALNVQTTCVTTGAIVPVPGDPVNTGNALVGVFSDAGGLTLSCFGGWVGALRTTAPAAPARSGAARR